MTEHTIRYATKSDFEGVMSIGDVYHGTDYLRHYYHSYMEDTDVRSYVYLIGDQVVGFCSGLLIDGGHTLITRAGRVRSNYRDQGIYGQLMKHVYNEYSQIEGIDFEVMTTNTMNSKKDKLQKQYTEGYNKIITSVLCDVSDIEVTDEVSSVLSTEALTGEEISSIFSTEGTREDLFPGGRLIVDWRPYKPLASNLKHMIQPGSLALRTKDTHQATLLMSFASSFPCEIGFKCIVDVLGNDISHLLDHLVLHLKNVKKLTQGKVFFQVVTYEKYKKDTEEILAKLKLQPCDFPSRSVHYFGRTFPDC